MLSDGKHESKKPCSLSKVFVKRQAWVLQSGDLFLQAIEGATIQWTVNPAEAMSWLDPGLAAERLQMIPALTKVIGASAPTSHGQSARSSPNPAPSSRLTLLAFIAQIGQHPLQWRHEAETPGVQAK